uniref:(northern house mosquito) hypothetical protein n=1 Tax=Culex pipiens TaxID=7175 RepID=A0A8D8B3X2_CULPI
MSQTDGPLTQIARDDGAVEAGQRGHPLQVDNLALRSAFRAESVAEGAPVVGLVLVRLRLGWIEWGQEGAFPEEDGQKEAAKVGVFLPQGHDDGGDREGARRVVRDEQVRLVLE